MFNCRQEIMVSNKMKDRKKPINIEEDDDDNNNYLQNKKKRKMILCRFILNEQFQ